MDRYVLSALVQNHAGVLSRISGLFSRRGYNIDSLTVGETQDPGVSRMTIVVRGDEATIEQIQKQLEKLVEVGAVRLLDSSKAVYRELALIKVAAAAEARPEIIQIAGIFRARIVDVSHETLTVEATGDQAKIDGLLELLAPFGVRELARTGIAALERGPLLLSLI
jgi:acetolactate synthase I/III small subunit